MFTIRHVDGSVDNLYQADRVTFFDPTRYSTPGTATGEIKSPALLGALELRSFPDTFVAGLWGGMAYVMNANGATVARYDLPPDPTRLASAGIIGPNDAASVVGSKLPKREKPEFFDKRYDNVVD